MNDVIDFAAFDPSTERDLFGPLPDPQILKFARRTQLDKHAPKPATPTPVAPGLSPGILIGPRAA